MTATEFTPVRLSAMLCETLWGGRQLLAAVAPASRLANAGEIILFSNDARMGSLVASGELAGLPLTVAYPSLLCGRPMTVKLLDAAQPLSVQVHPGDGEAAGERYGKDECWYVLSADDGAMLFCGLKPDVSVDMLRQATKTGDVTSLLCSVPAHAGDCYCIPAGTPHALGGGVRVLEVACGCSVTYRLDDYGRRDADGQPRALAVEDALRVLKTNRDPAAPMPYASLQCHSATLGACPLPVSCAPYSVLIGAAGGCTVCMDGVTVHAAPFDCYLLPHGCEVQLTQGDLFSVLPLSHQ